MKPGDSTSGTAHGMRGHSMQDCPHCLIKPKMARSAKFAWTVAGIAIALLVIVFFAGVGSSGGTLAGLGGVALLMIIACPVGMGLMVWMMARMNKH